MTTTVTDEILDRLRSSLVARQGVFLRYAVLAVAAFVARVPETRHRSLEDIQSDLTGQRHQGAGGHKATDRRCEEQ